MNELKKGIVNYDMIGDYGVNHGQRSVSGLLIEKEKVVVVLTFPKNTNWREQIISRDRINNITYNDSVHPHITK